MGWVGEGAKGCVKIGYNIWKWGGQGKPGRKLGGAGSWYQLGPGCGQGQEWHFLFTFGPASVAKCELFGHFQLFVGYSYQLLDTKNQIKSKQTNKQNNRCPDKKARCMKSVQQVCGGLREPAVPSNFLRHLPSPGSQSPELKIKEKRGSGVILTSLLSVWA